MSPLAGKRKITSSSPMSGSRLGKRSKSNSFGGQLTQRRVSGPRYVVMRYKALGGSIDLSGQNLVASAGVLEISATSAYALNESIRIHHVRVLGKPPQGATDITEVAVEFTGGGNRGDNDRVVNSSNNPNIAPRVYVRPSRYATASDWVNNNVTDNMCSISCPAGSIVEIGMMVTSPEEGQTLSTVSISGGTGGVFNYLKPSNQLEVIA